MDPGTGRQTPEGRNSHWCSQNIPRKTDRFKIVTICANYLQVEPFVPHPQGIASSVSSAARYTDNF